MDKIRKKPQNRVIFHKELKSEMLYFSSERKTMVKVELDISEEIYSFLKAIHEFGGSTIEKYMEKVIASSVDVDINSMAGDSDLFDEEALRTRYGL